jgi:alkaline phosphatase
MKISITKFVLLLLTGSSLLSACSDNKSSVQVTADKKVKNVILMIGDGMGVQQIGLLEEYAQRAPNSLYNTRGNETGLQKFSNAGHIGLSLTAPMGADGNLVVDSACSASQLASGIAAGSEMIGLDDQGNVVETILEKAKKMGKATGLVSDTRITHATPAAFAAHQPHRSYESAIAEQLIESGSVDVLLSGGVRHFVPSDIKTNKQAQKVMMDLGADKSLYKKSKRKDARNLIAEAKNKYGFSLAFDKEQLARVNTGDNTNKLLGLFANSGMADGIEYSNCKVSNTCTQPSLTEMTVKALDILSQNENGFFLMVEGGQIDWAGHVNDAGWLLHELLKFDEAITAVYNWVKDRDDTLVVITGDHETGGFGFSYSRKDLPASKTLSGNGMQGKDYKPNFNFASVSHLDKLHAQSATFYTMMSEVNSDWDFSKTTGSQWAKAINAHVHADYQVSEQEAQNISKREPNKFFVAKHKYLSAKEFPAINDFKEFFVYGDDLHANLIGRTLAADQNVVWGTGTHTASPVAVYAFGPQEISSQFSTLQHHVDVSKKMMAAFITE